MGRVRREWREVIQHLIEYLLYLFRAVQQGKNIPFRCLCIPMMGVGPRFLNQLIFRELEMNIL